MHQQVGGKKSRKAIVALLLLAYLAGLAFLIHQDPELLSDGGATASSASSSAAFSAQTSSALFWPVVIGLGALGGIAVGLSMRRDRN